MSDKLARVRVEISTLAKPVAESLLAARAAIQVRPELQDLFKQARAKNWSSEGLADALYVHLTDYVLDTENLWDTALYLADEFMQLKEEDVLLVARETGKAICKITEKDVYIPVVSREDGRLVKGLPRLRPDLEGFIVRYQFEVSREQQIVQTLAQRVQTTEFLSKEGDNRLLRATRFGRKKIVDMLRADLPLLLSESQTEFLNLFYFCAPSEIPKEFETGRDSTARATVITPIIDPLSVNLRYDPFTLLKKQIKSQWIRSIAQVISDIVISKTEAISASTLDTLPSGFWLAEPNVAIALRGKKILPVVGIKTIMLHDWLSPIACLCVNPNSYDCQSREYLERWEIGAVCEFTLYIKPNSFSVYNFKDVQESGLAVEVI
jgi:hypothetical protein